MQGQVEPFGQLQREKHAVGTCELLHRSSALTIMNSMAQIMPAPPTVKVYYGKPILPDVSRVLACLYEKEIEFELVDMYKGQRMPAEILKLQATMRAPVPAFEDSNKLLLESRAICRYVAEKYADQGNRYLLGRDLLERGSIEQWLKTEEQSFNPPSWTIVFHLAFNPQPYVDEQDQSLMAQNGRMLAQVLDVYEHRLRESKYLAGDEFTLADLSHIPNAHYLANSDDWSYLFTSRKNVQRWWEKISSRPSWEKVVGMFLKNTSTVAEDVATNQGKSPQQQSSESSGSSTIQLGRLSKAPDRASLSPEPSSKVGQPTSSATQSNSTIPEVPESKPQPQQGHSSIGQPVPGTTVPNLREEAPQVPESKPQSETRSQPQQGDPKDAKSKPQPKETQQPGTTQSNLGADASAPRAPPSQPQLEKTPPQDVSKPQSETAPQLQRGELSNGQPTKSNLGADATDPKTANFRPQLKETQPPQGDSTIGQPTSGTTQSKLGADASAPKAPKPQLEKTQSQSDSSTPQATSVNTQSNLGEGTLSNPQSETSRQPQQGDSFTDQSKNTMKESNKGADAPIDQSIPQENPENQKIGQPDSTASSATSNKPNAQSSADNKPESKR